MINSKDNQVEWASLMYELEDAREHLESLVNQMPEKGIIDEVDYSVDLGHVFAHLNRAWNTRHLKQQIPKEQWAEYSGFPNDLEPVG